MLLKMSEHFRRPELWNWKYYKAVVVDNKDPLKIGRARVTIDGIYPEGKNDLLPWVGRLTDNLKTFEAPEVGDELCVIFPFDDVYHPFYIGHWSTGTKGIEYLQDDYPNTFGFVYENLKARFNKSTKVGQIVHSTGTGISIDADGNLTLTVAKDYIQNPSKKYSLTSGDDMSFSSATKLSLGSTGDMSFNSGAKMNIEAAADVTIKAGAKMTITATGALAVTSDAKAEFSGKSGTDLGSASSMTTVLGSQVMLGGQGGSPVALVGMSMVMGPGNLGAPVISQILTGATKVMAT